MAQTARRMRRSNYYLASAAAALGVMALTTFAVSALFNRTPALDPVAAHYPVVELGKRVALSFPNERLYAISRDSTDEFDGYSGLRKVKPALAEDVKSALVVTRPAGRAALVIELPNDLLTAIPAVQRLASSGTASVDSDWNLATSETFQKWSEESSLFDAAYSGLPDVRPRAPDTPHIVADLVSLSKTFRLPLRVFQRFTDPDADALGLRWKARADEQDIIVSRVPGQVLTADVNAVSWHEIRTALVHAHSLLRTCYDSYGIPADLRPPSEFRDDMPARALLTYAAVLLRDLANRTGIQDADLLNGYMDSTDDPNIRHDVGVRRSALVARRVLAYGFRVNRELAVIGNAPSGR